MANICQEVKNPLDDMCCTSSLLEATNLTENQKQYLEASAACERQMSKIIRMMLWKTSRMVHLTIDKEEFFLGVQYSEACIELCKEMNLKVVDLGLQFRKEKLQSCTSSEATEKEVLFSDERVGLHLSGNKESSGWYVLYKLIVGGHTFDRNQKLYLEASAACDWQMSKITRMVLWKTLRMGRLGFRLAEPCSFCSHYLLNCPPADEAKFVKIQVFRDLYRAVQRDESEGC
ncbi:hypothetical protein HAX54_002109 [Datura stramonium]|uniref:Signal transduction histidine kinase dimerisation/phosphoacceptor domain-containing protein n=1 Tax=Datura stramonium TaxID=4076 RepID=A0ABS8T3E7_DATST|nr:hypothetical protein [Datura stramonium]